ncbi:MAG TPA: inositol monophosphatase family protein [Thermosynechococcaceae cyanobacterium]
MTPISPSADRQIQQILHTCGQLAEQRSTQPFEVHQKGIEDYVTSVDAELDRTLSAAFSGWFPTDGIVTEENEESRRKYTGHHDRLWCIDPIDGTENFIRHKPDYAIMIGLLQAYQPIAGWVHAPATEVTYWGGPGWGLFCSTSERPNEALLIREPFPPTTTFCPVIIGYRDQKQFGQAIAEFIPQVQFYSLGSFGLKVMEVVLGRAGLYLYFNRRVKVWDTAGPIALAKAAGLVCCDLDGQPISFSPEAIDLDTLAHKQVILVGWAAYVESLRPKLKAAVEAVCPPLG